MPRGDTRTRHPLTDADNVGFRPRVPGDWTDPDPQTVDEALNDLAGGDAHDILDGSTHTDSTAAAVSQGSMIVGDKTPKWVELTIGANGEVLTSDGADILWQAPAAPSAHKDSHDPEDGGDPLDCAAPPELAGIQASGEGSAHEFARSDHAHQIQHSIADNHLVTIDHAGVVDDDYAKFTADGLEGRSYAEVLGDIEAVKGPGASTDHAIARWDGVTGKLLQDSYGLLDDAGSLTVEGGNHVFGHAGRPGDITLTFITDIAVGAVYWKRNEDYFHFLDDILLNLTERLYFRGTGNFIHSRAVDIIALDAVTTVEIGHGGATYIGDYAGGHYVEVKSDGEINLHGTARVTKSIDMAGSDFSKGNQGPEWLKIGNYSAWQYDIGDDTLLTFELPHDWAVGTDVKIYVDWGCDEAYVTNSGEVQWNVSWSAVPHDASEALDAVSTTLDPGDQDIPATAKFLARTEIGTIAGGSLAAEDEIGLKIERVALDGGNNPTADPFITHFHIEYTADKIGEAT